jgi:hypothetical protein
MYRRTQDAECVNISWDCKSFGKLFDYYSKKIAIEGYRPAGTRAQKSLLEDEKLLEKWYDFRTRWHKKSWVIGATSTRLLF